MQAKGNWKQKINNQLTLLIFLPEHGKIVPVPLYNEVFFLVPGIHSSILTNQSLSWLRVNTVYNYFSNDISQLPNI